MALTYLVADDESMLWRLSAGSIIGSAIFGMAAFLAGCLFAFGPATIILSAIVAMLPLLLLRQAAIAKRFKIDRARAKGRLQGANLQKALRFAYYAFFFLLFWFFFERVMFIDKGAILTGGSQNLGDLPFHLGAIFGFTDGNNFPPVNPSWAGAKFSYPFIADLLSACLVKLGVDAATAIFIFDLTWAFALLVILERFVVKITDNRLAGRIAPALLFFSGGLGFLWFFNDYWGSGKGFFDFLWNLPKDYTISDKFRWGNSMVVLFMTQRSLLLGMPLTVLVLGYLWRVFGSERVSEHQNDAKDKPKAAASAPVVRALMVPFLVGVFAGTLPLIHLHSLAVLFVVTAFLFAMRPDRWREWIAFGIGVAIIAVPELAWAITDTATDSTKFIGWHFGWDKGNSNILWFWLKNTGIMIPLIGVGIYLVDLARGAKDEAPEKNRISSGAAKNLLLFYLPFVALFIVSNVVKLAPWEWDNIKILIYWFVASLPLAAYVLARAWQAGKPWTVVAGLCFIVLVLSGGLDVWRTASRQINYGVFDADAVKLAEQIKAKTEPNALFLNAPTYNPAVVLSGRQSLMRYSGHLSSHGIDYLPRENEVKQIYLGGGSADVLLKKNNVDYVLISPFERNELKANEEFFKKFPVVAESGQYKVYKVK